MAAPRENRVDALSDARRRLAKAVPPHVGWVPAGARVSPPPDGAARAGHDEAQVRRSERPGERSEYIWGVSGRATAGLAALALLAVLLGVSYLWRGRPQPVEVPRLSPASSTSAQGWATPRSPSPPAPSPSSAAAPGPAPHLLVHVAGLVKRPGLVQLPPGSRVDDALRAAGGTKGAADVSSVNLARPLSDGEQLVVLARGTAPGKPAPVGQPGAAAGAAAPTGPLDLNSATSEQLQELPGVGPVLAGRILEWRTQHGRFSSVDELREVSGIGERTFASLAPAVRV